MPDENSPSPTALTVTDAWCLLVGLALGAGLGNLIHNPATGIGTGIAIGIASNMMRRAGNPQWMIWLGLYSVIVLIAYALKVTGVLK